MKKLLSVLMLCLSFGAKSSLLPGMELNTYEWNVIKNPYNNMDTGMSELIAYLSNEDGSYIYSLYDMKLNHWVFVIYSEKFKGFDFNKDVVVELETDSGKIDHYSAVYSNGTILINGNNENDIVKLTRYIKNEESVWFSIFHDDENGDTRRVDQNFILVGSSKALDLIEMISS
ncbi:hypothetical protein [Endozoicomonas sp. 4G]|uniref:hypothetical protein n=1 Tax=Endozoicomonas sp. 4G TaxID=2872754 RepID=UPI002078A2A9|nr:hypothetical protein [Endozoicomonas sp. 4G]